jgi:3'(2'), 5'-bisphosphate nucleotidase
MNTMYDIAIRAAIEAGNKILEIYSRDDLEIEKKADESPLTLADRASHEIIASRLRQTSYPILSEEGRDIPFSERSSWKKFWLVDPLDGTKEFIRKNGEFTVNIALIQHHKPIFGVVYTPVLNELYVGIPNQNAWLVHNPTHTLTIDDIQSEDTALRNQHKTTLQPYKIVASRSHLNAETEKYIESVRTGHQTIDLISKGSSLKLLMVASGQADEYPRLGPTMEWDVAAAHAVVNGAGKKVYDFQSYLKDKNPKELTYNKKNLLNPHFLVK